MSNAGVEYAGEMENRNEWLTTPRFALLLAGSIILFFPAIIFGGHSFVFRDFGFYSYPVALHLRESFWRGEFPLWNPLNDCGTPFLAQWSTGVLYPFSLFYILLPVTWALGVFCLIHLFIAGMGMYLLALHWTQHRLGAAVAGLSFTFSAVVLNCLVWPHYMIFFAWMPFVFLTVQHACSEGGRKIIWAIFVGALHMLSGMPEFIALTWLMVGLVWLSQCISRELAWIQSLRRLLVIVIAIAALTAAQLLPFFELLRHSHRGADLGSAWSMPPTGIANFFVPLFNCFKMGPGLFMQPTQQLFPSYYLALTVLALAVFAIWRVRQSRVRILAGTIILSLLLSLGDAGLVFPALKTIFPGLGLMRYPIKLVLPIVFFVPLLAAYGVREATAFPPEKIKKAFAFFISSWGISVVLIALILWLSSRDNAWSSNWAELRLNGFTRILFTTLGVCFVIFLLRPQERPRQIVFSLGLLICVWLDGVTHMPNLNVSVPSGVYEPGLPVFRDMKPRPAAGENRAMPLFEATQSLYKTSLTDPSANVLCGRLSLFANCNLFEDVPKVNGFFSLHPRYSEMLRSFIDGQGTNLPPIVDFIGVSHTTIPGNIFEWQARTNYMPFITAGQQVAWIKGETNLILSLLDPRFNPRKVIYMAQEDQGLVAATNQTDAKVLSHKYSRHRIEAEVETSQPSVVAIAQSYYPAWKAYVDEKPAPLLRANYAFQAVEIPAGRHKVKVVYEDRMFKTGVIISGLTLMACLTFLFVASRRRPETNITAHG